MSRLTIKKKINLEKPKVLFIVGPTASGKSDLAIYLAKKFKGEVISADSRQVYRGMDIGTAKPTRDHTNEHRMKTNQERIRLTFDSIRKGFERYMSGGVRHHLVDIRNINQSFNVKSFKTLAERAIRDIAKRGKLPIVVGGTGLYIKALIDNLTLTETRPNQRLRRRLETDLKNKGLDSLYEKLIKLDPESAYIVDSRNPRRVIRALEIALTQRKPLSELRKKREPFFEPFQIGIEIRREKLKKRIEKRIEKEMIKNGLVDEVKTLVKKYGKYHEPLSALGYREIIDYLDGKISLQEAISQNQAATWRYAKKQLAWFKKDPRVHWIRTKRQAEELVKQFLS